MDTELGTTTSQPARDEFFAGDGEMAALMRALDWSQTALGPPHNWPQSLKTTVRILLTSRYAMWMAWGPELTFFCNDAYRPTLGVKSAWALGAGARSVWEEIWPEIGPRIESVFKTGKATWDEGLLLFLERSGYPEETYHTFSYSPLADDHGVISGMLCVVMEETERFIGDRRLALLRDVGASLASVQTVQQIFAATAACVEAKPRDLPFTLTYLFDSDGGTARLVSRTGIPSAEAAFGRDAATRDTGAGWPIRDMPSDPAPVVVDELHRYFLEVPCGSWDKPPRQAVIFPIAQQGQDRLAGFMVAGINPYRQLDDKYRDFIGLLVGQISASLASVRAYEEEKKRAEALQELDRAKTAFFSNVSHEFRTPLTLMLGPIEDALGNDGQALAGESLRTVHRNSLRLLKLVNTLLDFTRIEAGRVRASYEPVDLGSYTADLASVFRTAVEKAGLSLVVDCAPSPHVVYVDKEMWEKIVLNLLSNAFKFTLEGGIEVCVREESDRSVLTVRDTGSGIAEEQLPHIFERFHRVEGARSRSHEGTGIGLALVRELVNLHGGTVSVASRSGIGTTFTVTLPLGAAHLASGCISAPSSESSTALRAETVVEEALRWLPDGAGDTEDTSFLAADPGFHGDPPTPAERPRILLADDNADMRSYVARLLQPHYNVVAVANGEDALGSARHARPDLIISDVMMPVLSGIGLLQAIRSDPEIAAVPIILLSARAGEEARIEGLDAGADDYLIKPFSARELLARVASQLKLAKIRADAERAIRVSEARLKTLVDEAPLGIYLLDADFRFAEINPVARPVFAAITDLIGRDFEEVIRQVRSPDYADEIVRTFRHTLETGEPFSTPELFHDRPELGVNEFYEWRTNRILLPDGRFGLVCYFRDISAQVHARHELARSANRVRETANQLILITDTAPVYLVHCDAEARFKFVNRGYAARFGLLPMECVGRRISDVIGEAAYEAIGRYVNRVLGGEAVEFDAEIPYVSIGSRFVHCSYVPEVDPEGKVIGFVAALTDITDRRRMEEEVEALNVRLQRAMTETHHRVKNNLQLISALIDMQRSTGEDTVPVSEFARLGANVRALSVIHDILTQQARAGSDQDALSVKAVLEKLLAGLRQTIGPRALMHDVDDIQLVGRQATSLALITNELIANALKHGRGATEVTFKVDPLLAVLSVVDDGPGFPEDFNAETAANIGLDLVENIVRYDLRGQIAYYNRVEGGAQINVTFPVVERAQEESE